MFDNKFCLGGLAYFLGSGLVHSKLGLMAYHHFFLVKQGHPAYIVERGH